MNGKRLIVMKFGGTSVGNAERFRQCADIVDRAFLTDDIIVVVSAVAGVTDLIFQTIEAARKGDLGVTNAKLDKFERIHKELIAELFEPPRSEVVLEFASRIFASLHTSCSALLALHGDASTQTQDFLAALGERISAWIFANYLQQLGTSCRFIAAEDVIGTDSNFGNASPLMDLTTIRCEQELLGSLKQHIVPVVAGYAGSDELGRTTTLGRGGSDYSATILGAACTADEVWIWTDVDGILTADPRICPAATSFSEISFTRAIELACHGAKVLHPKAAYLAMESGIPVWIKNSFRPELPGTHIVQNTTHSSLSVHAIACIRNASLITLTAKHQIPTSELFGRVLLCFAQAKLDPLLATQSSSKRALVIAVRSEDSTHALAMINSLLGFEIEYGLVGSPIFENDIATIAILGGSPEYSWNNIGIAFSSLARNQISVIALSQGTNELNVCFAVPSRHCATAVRIVHDELYKNASLTISPSKSSLVALQ